jgi:serine/threonine protein phosphatase PrpC
MSGELKSLPEDAPRDEEARMPLSMGAVRNVEEVAPLQLSWSGQTHVGRVRQNNEDAFLALTVDGQGVRYLGKIGEGRLNGSDFIFAVSDGMGGEKSGEFASRIAVDKITRMMPRYFQLRAAGLPTGFADILSELFHQIHGEITRMGASYEECRNMGATLSLGWFVPGWMYFGHIGDSRIYYLPAAGGIRQVTQDDSHVGWLRRTGQINEREQRTHPRKNVLAKALGAGHRYVEPQTGAVAVEAGDAFLFCTDGLNDGLWDRALQELIREPRLAAVGVPAAQRLVEEANRESGRDNITAVVVQVGE